MTKFSHLGGWISAWTGVGVAVTRVESPIGCPILGIGITVNAIAIVLAITDVQAMKGFVRHWRMEIVNVHAVLVSAKLIDGRMRSQTLTAYQIWIVTAVVVWLCKYIGLQFGTEHKNIFEAQMIDMHVAEQNFDSKEYQLFIL